MKANKDSSGIFLKIICIVLICVVGVLCISSAQGSVEDLLNADQSGEATLPVNIPTHSFAPLPTDTPYPSESFTSPSANISDSPVSSTADNSTSAVPSAWPTSSPASPSTPPQPSFPSESTIGQLVHKGTAQELAHYTSSDLEFIITKVSREKLVFYTVEIQLTSPYQLLTAFANNKITGKDYTSNIAKKNNALLAINGDYCGYNSNGVIIRNGISYRNVPSTRNLLMYDSQGNFSYAPEKSVNADTLVSQGIFHSFSFGPVLIENGQATSNQTLKDHFLSHRVREPRTAIGQIGNLHYLLLVVDGRQESSQGMLFTELQETLLSYGVVSAYNLDGGGSSTLYYNGKAINSPCVEGERKVSDIIFIKG